jgi:hypothetical protein
VFLGIIFNSLRKNKFLGRPTHIMENNIKMYFREIICDDVLESVYSGHGPISR